MNTPPRNTFVFIALLCAAIAAGCAGGGGGAPKIPTPPGGGQVTFPPPPPPVPTNNSWQPSPPPNFSNAYFYTGVITTVFRRLPVIQTPTPSPNPTMTALFVKTASINSLVTDQQTFPLTGQAGLVGYNTSEADTGTVGQINLVNTLSNTYYQYVQDANPKLTDVYIVGSIADSEAGTPDQIEYTTTYYPGTGNHTNGLIDVVPEPTKTGQNVPVGPPNDASVLTTEADPDGQKTAIAVNADGSYTENVVYPDGTKSSLQESANGPSGLYSIPFPVDPAFPKVNSTVEVDAPSAGNIPITVTYAAGTFNSGSKKVVHVNIPVWYPKPATLYSQTYQNQGPTNLPNPFPSPNPFTAGACNLGNDINGLLLKHIQQKPYSNLLVQTTKRLDVVFGEMETTTTRIWNTQGIGLTCSDTLDTVQQFYDYSGQGIYVPMLQNKPLQVTTTDVQIGLTQATINNQSYKFGQQAGARTRGFGQQHSAPLRGGQALGRFAPGAQTMQNGMRGSDMLLARTLMQETQVKLQRERLKRHAAYWRAIRALRGRRAL